MSGAPAGGGSIAARFVAIDATHWSGPTRIVWDHRGRIVSLRRTRDPVADVMVLPGLVNAHAHLQLPALPAPVREFLPWVGAVMASRQAVTAAAERAAVAGAVGELLAGGTTAIGEIDSSGSSLSAMARTPVIGRCYRELTGYHLDAAAARELVPQRRQSARGAIVVGLSPHAPYSVSLALFQAAHRASKHLAIHCAELPEEQQFLHTGRGPFADLLQRLGRLPAGHRPPRCGAVRWLEQSAVLGPRTQLIHCQELERGDLARIAAAGASIVVCPGTIEYFGRRPPPVPRWLANGIPVALGTDSRASNTGLCMRRELQRAARLWPELAPAQLLAMATTHGGRSLDLPVGRLRRGSRADLLVIPAAATAAATVQGFVAGAAPEPVVYAAGRRQRSRRQPAS